MGSITSRLRLGFTALAVLLLAIAVIRALIADQLVSDFNGRVERIEAAREANARYLQKLTDAETGVRGFQLTGDPTFLQPYTSGRAEAERAIAEAYGRAPDDEIERLLDAEAAAGRWWLTRYATAAADRRAEPASATQAAAAGKRMFDDLRRANAAVDRALLVRRDQSAAHFGGMMRAAELISIGLSLLAALLSLVLGVNTSRHLLRPLNRMRSTLIRLGARESSVDGDGRRRSAPDVVRVLNGLAAETERMFTAERTSARVKTVARDIGIRVRGTLDPAAVLDEVVNQLGPALSAERVYVRVAGPPTNQWQRPGLSPLAAADGDAPDTMAVAFGVVDEELGTLHVALGGRSWTADERALVETVCDDLGRALQQARLYAQQAQFVAELSELTRQKDEFVSTVSHELRTPLTSIMGYLELINEPGAGRQPASERWLDAVDRNARRLHDTVSDLLLLSRQEARTVVLRRDPVDVADLVRDLHAAMEPDAAAAGLSFRCVVVDDAPVVGDRGQLRRALANLVGNAVKFTPAGGAVDLTLVAVADRIEVAVVDTGIGIPAADVGRLFAPFSRAGNAVASAVQGTGLGLALVRSIVEKHGGTVTVESVLDQGSRFAVLLPRALPQPGPAAEHQPMVMETG